MRIIRQAIIIGISALFCCSFSGCYLATQGYYAVRYQLGAHPVEKVLRDPATSDSIRSFIELTRRIRAFAADSLGLRDNRNYTSLVTLDKPYLVDVVCACAPDTFRPHTWYFPIVGRVPYKGFFRRTDALREAAVLRRKGLDVLVRGAGAYSSLGIIADPLYSFMARYSLFEVASMLIHEQTHATVYLKSNAAFNEQMAMFVGQEGALKFIAGTYGDTSVRFRQALDEKRDEEVYMRLVKELHDTLAAIYASTKTSQDRIAWKEPAIMRWRERLLAGRDSLFKTGEYRRGFERAVINNAYITEYMTYTADLGVLYRLYDKNRRDLRTTVEQLKGLGKAPGDPNVNLRKLAEVP